MRPAVLTNRVGGLHIYAIPGSHPLDQLLAKLSVASVRVALSLHLTQTLARSADDQIVEPYALATPPQGIKCLPHRGRLGDRMTRVARGHFRKCSTWYST
jgi:hypothetical protein